MSERYAFDLLAALLDARIERGGSAGAQFVDRALDRIAL